MGTQLELEGGTGAPRTVGEVSITDYLGVFPRRWPVIVVPAILVFAIAGTMALLLPKKYESVTTFKVLDATFANEVSKVVAPARDPKPMFASVDVDVKRAEFLDELIQRIGLDEGFDYHDPSERMELFAYVLNNLKVTRHEAKDKGKDDLIAIKYVGRDAQKVAAFLNAVREKYIASITDRYKDEVMVAREKLTASLERKKSEHSKAVRALADWESKAKLHLIEEGVARARSDTMDALLLAQSEDQEQLDRLERDYDKTREAVLRAGDTARVSPPSVIPLPGVDRPINPEYLAAEKRIRDLKTQVEQALTRYTDLAPQMKELRGRLASEESALEGMTKFLPVQRDARGRPVTTEDPTLELSRLQATQKEQLEDLRNRIERRKATMADVARDIQEIPELRKQHRELVYEVERVAEDMPPIERRLLGIEETWNRVVSKDSVFTATLTVPLQEDASFGKPIFPKVDLFLSAGAAIGLLVGVGLAFMAELTSQTFVTANQVRRTLPVPVLGEIGRLETLAQRRSRLRKRLLVLAVLLILGGAVAWVHMIYFDPERRHLLPTSFYSAMRRIYPAVR